MRRLSGLILGLFLFGCLPPNQVSMSLRGRVAFSQRHQPADKGKFRVAMEASDVIAGATISLIDDAKVTIATGLTDANGAFTLTTGAPPASGTYQLIAAKRVEGNGRLIHLATTVQFDGSTWRSTVDAGPEVVINPASTAVEIVTNAMGMPRSQRLGKVKLDEESNEYIALDPALYGETQEALLTLTEDVIFHVYDLVDFDIDPLRGVCFVNRVVTAEGDKTAGSVGLSRIKITGFGFDPVPERNSIGFQIGSQTIWTPALPGSSTQVLYARVPDLPHPTDGPVVKLNVPVHVRNGVGTLELNAGDPATFNVYFPKRIADPAIKLPDPTTPLSPGSLAVATGSLTGYVNLVWRDLRFASDTTKFAPLIRLWDLTSNSLASLVPMASDPNLPNKAADPAELPQVFVNESVGPPFTVMTHMIWQGVHTDHGRRNIFHRAAENGVWKPYEGHAPTGAATVVSLGAALANDQEPSAAMDDNRLFVAFTRETGTTSINYNVMARLWNGGFASNNTPNWATDASSQALSAFASSNQSARLPQVAVGSGTDRYHIAWFSHASGSPTSGSLVYRRGWQSGATALTWLPAISPMALPATIASGLTGFETLTMAADATNRVVVVWSDSTGLHSKRFKDELPTASTGKLDLPPLPGNAKETSPKLVAIGDDDFYLISASTPDGPLGVAGEIWLRRYKANVWSDPIKVHHSPGIPSEQPSLNWNGGNLTAAWLENRTPVAFSIYGNI